MNNLRKIREKLGLSQKKVAEDCGFAQNTFCQYETGVRKMSAQTAIKIAKYLGVTVEDLYKE